MKEAFFDLAGRLARELRAGELLVSSLAAERSDFVRFNQGKVRQAGSVGQRYLTLRLVRARRQASATTSADDPAALKDILSSLRRTLEGLPEDPWLLVNEEPLASHQERRGALAPAPALVEQVTARAAGHDLVGFYAGGTIYRGLAASSGARHWHEVDSFGFDWSLYREADRAVKAGYAGLEWREADFARILQGALELLPLLERPRRIIAPGEYRAYLAPRALEEIASLLCWGGFSARARATKQSPLLRMENGERLSPKLSLKENTGEGLGAAFQADGFVKPPQVGLVAAGRLGEALVSPRSAKEYGLETNAANGAESPEALDLAPGALAAGDALAALDTGLYISNLWYLNYSDRPAGRITGMTRFATFWVERGRIVAPAAPLRFDDSIYRILGANLVDFTRERELFLSSSTYGARSTASMRLPGALLGGLRFTL